MADNINITHIMASREYDCIVGSDILKDIGKMLSRVISPCKVCIITDSTVEKLYLETVKESIESNGYEVITFVFKSGEKSKSIETLTDILEFLAQNEMTRSDIITSLGGGVVGDVSGFAAATYMRGIEYIQIPTTLLSAIDSSVGGKTAVNLKSGKNLFGAFHQPSLVVCDTKTFDTLPSEIFADGVAETIKYAMLCDMEIASLINTDIQKAVTRCIEIKSEFVAKDEFDKGLRELLNFGHTLGHTIENLSGYSITHGYAVAIGMAIVTLASEKNNICESGTYDKLVSILKENKLPYETDISIEKMCEVAKRDKKRKGSTLDLILPKKCGECFVKKIDISSLKEFFK